MTFGEKIFEVFNHLFLGFLGVICVIPFLHVAAVAFSSSTAATQGIVGIWPKSFTLSSFQYAFQQPAFIAAFLMTIKRVLIGVTLDLTMVVLTAYPLSKTNRQLPGRTYISWIFVLTMFVSGGLIPSYLVVSAMGLKDSIWALVIPGCVQVWNITILLNFFRQIPKELEEAAVIDGASQIKILVRIYLPLSVPALATLLIFDTVGHWNEWFNAIIYMRDQSMYPLQTYLQSMVINPADALIDINQTELLSKISSETFRAAQILIATVPILCIYPFLQKYFVKGLTLGSLKG